MLVIRILGLCISSFVISIIVDVISTLRINKIAADEGLKINNNKVIRTGNDISPSLVQLSFLSMFIPGVNVLSSLNRNMKIKLAPWDI